MTDNLTFKGEALLLSWSDSTAGRKVTFLLPDDGTEHPFKGYKTGPKYGQPFALGCQAIDYDNPEQPAEPQPGDPVRSVKGYAKPPMTDSQVCGMMCADETFQAWLARTFPDEWKAVSGGQYGPDDAAAMVVRNLLKITSRRELDDKHKYITKQAWHEMLQAFRADAILDDRSPA